MLLNRGPRPRTHLAVVSFTLAVAFGAGCGGSTPGAKSAIASHGSKCLVDETREYFCDELAAEGNVPAPAPYEACSWTVENAVGDYDPPPTVATFDASYTEYTRKRAPPGHACCYSWCSKLTLADSSVAASDPACQNPAAFREEYCMAEPEAGVSDSASGYSKCPEAIVPPPKAVFASPKAAGFDPELTAKKRTSGENLCCYAWCSLAPPGSGLEKKK